MNPATSAPTMVDHGESRLLALCEAAGFTNRKKEIIDGYRTMSASWGQRRVDQPPLWSFATADSTPMELSVALEDRPAGIGVAVEAQADPATARSYWASAQALTAALGTEFGLPLHRLRSVEDMFCPPAASAAWQARSMVAYHAMNWPRQGPPTVKVYFWAAGSSRNSLADALGRLGFAAEWAQIARILHADDVVSYICLDLADDASARTKLYIQHRGELSAQRLARVGRLSPNYAPEQGAEMVALLNQAENKSSWPQEISQRDRLQQRSNNRRHWSVATYLSLVAGRPDRIDEAVHQICLATLARSDAEASDLVREVITAYDLGPSSRAAYERCLQVFTQPPLALERYAHTFLSAARGADGGARVVVYFSPRMFLSRHGLSNGDLNQAWEWSRT